MPSKLDIPTGLGKTSVIPIWLIALAGSLGSNTGRRVPRRLVYIVDRRVIVDQATEVARRIADSAAANSAALGGLSRMHISTFRGGGIAADSREWMRHPDEPAVLIGTVDMIGSRLLFSGYGLSRSVRPFYAGLLGQDSLIILDEAHLSPALVRTLFDLEKIAGKAPEPLFPPKVMLMSATSRPSDLHRGVFTLDDDDFRSPAVIQKYEAKKMLSLKDTGDKDLASAVTDQALSMSGRTLIYVQTPSNAASIAAKLRAEKKPAVVLTGTMRGFERDRLTRKYSSSKRGGDSQGAPGSEPSLQTLEKDKNEPGGSDDNAIFNAFVPNDADACAGDCYLVSTSAGEVGVDIDADNMVCDLTTFDSLIQRLGRVNRSGGRTSRVLVVWSDAAISKSRSLSGQLKKTLALLKDLTGQDAAGSDVYNASPRALSEIAEGRKEGTAAPDPLTQPLVPDIVGMWSMTSLYEAHPSRPSVHHWLRGHDENHIPDTYVAWRTDVSDLAEADPDSICDVLDKYPVLPHELARGTTTDVRKILEKISSKKRGKKAIIQKPDSAVLVKKVEEIGDDDLRYSTVLLPCSAGGLDESGLLAASSSPVRDVADDPRYRNRRRITVHVWADGRAAVAADKDGDGDGDMQDLDEWIAGNKNMKLVSYVVTSIDEDDYERPTTELRYYVEKPDSQHSASTAPQSVEDHNRAVKGAAERIAVNLGINAGLADAVKAAAARHDLGKAHRHWQECMHGDVHSPLAKTSSRMRPLSLGGFRHEFESMRRSYDGLEDHPERDLVLHLIASHHGWSRPCFRPNASSDASEGDRLDAMRRYAALEKRFGPWGLAWLEGIVRGADWEASERQETDRG